METQGDNNNNNNNANHDNANKDNDIFDDEVVLGDLSEETWTLTTDLSTIKITSTSMCSFTKLPMARTTRMQKSTPILMRMKTNHFLTTEAFNATINVSRLPFQPKCKIKKALFPKRARSLR